MTSKLMNSKLFFYVAVAVAVAVVGCCFVFLTDYASLRNST